MGRWRNGTTLQALVFDKDKWTAGEARQWSKANGFRCSRARDEGNTIEMQQHDRKKFRRRSFRTVYLDDGVHGIVAVPVEPIAGENEEQTFGEWLKETRAEISENKKAVAAEWRKQKAYVVQKRREFRSDHWKADPIGDFFKWAKKRMR